MVSESSQAFQQCNCICVYALVYRQREFFDHRKEKQRRTESVEESRKPHTLADYIQQNLHGGESLDILGLRNLNPTAADACTTENPDVNFPDHPANGLPSSLY